MCRFREAGSFLVVDPNQSMSKRANFAHDIECFSEGLSERVNKGVNGGFEAS